MSDYPMLISNKLHSFRNFWEQKYDKKVICGKKAVRVLLQVSILRIGLLFLTHIYQIYFQMIGYNRSVYIRQCFHCFPCTSNHFVSFCLFILFFKKGPTT